VSLVSDLPQSCRSHYVGIDNNKAGRSAARLTGMAHAGLAGRVLIAAGSLDASDHLDRLEGFRSVIEQDFPNIDVLDVMDKHDQISAIYNVGAGNEGLIDMLRTVERRQPFCCIVHELIEPTRRALEDGTIDVVIDQRPEIEVDRALTRLKALIWRIATTTPMKCSWANGWKSTYVLPSPIGTLLRGPVATRLVAKHSSALGSATAWNWPV